MGGPGSGNRSRYGAKSSTDDYRTLDVRRWAREGMLRPGHWGGWQWTRNGEVVASIQMRAEEDRVILIYRHRSSGDEWKDERFKVYKTFLYTPTYTFIYLTRLSARVAARSGSAPRA